MPGIEAQNHETHPLGASETSAVLSKSEVKCSQGEIVK